MQPLGVVASCISALTAAAGWVVHRVRALTVTSHSWACMDCGLSNELDRDTCWSCGSGYGQDPLYPSPIPFDRRWLCASCAVWNGLARTDCWRCGTIREGAPVRWPVGGVREHLPGSPAASTRGASTNRTRRRPRAGDTSRRRNS